MDVHRYSGRDPLEQVDIQKSLVEALDTAADQVGLDRDAWCRQEGGDSELAVLPADVDEAVVVADFTRELAISLRRQNRSRRHECRLRVRMAMHCGVLLEGANGYAARAPVEACRLRDSAELRKALASRANADLALIVSDVLFRDIVEPGYRGLQPDRFQQVSVCEKEYRGVGYILLPEQAAPVAGTDRPDQGTPVLGGIVAKADHGIANASTVIGGQHMLTRSESGQPRGVRRD
ncbi:hypothetical protein [Actinomadura keratinilytica]|uniref:Uncharacterized protein n=1 Tax=Actinomadura keratinilytica TaxID=547461 RepID=A0ABP6UNG7_9ACTN